MSVFNKQEIIKQFGKNENDAGGTQVQIALTTHRIQYLADHMKKHHKDNHSKRGLLLLIARRRKLLYYLKSKSFDSYSFMLKSLGLRK
jgi:small subunit ribosomal protein S15